MKYGEKRYNYELYEIFNDSDFVSYIKVKRVAWAWHLKRLNDNRALKENVNTLRTGSFKLFKSPFPVFLTILNL
jgi:hypothetical protein